MPRQETRGRGSPPLFEKPCQHVPEMVLTAKKDRENPDIAFLFDDIEPDDGPAKSRMAKVGQDVFMQ